MQHIYSRGLAKINIALDIVRKRDDGYHEIDTVMQSLGLYDGLYIKKVYKPDYLKLVSNMPWLPEDHRNLAWQAARYLIDKFAIKEGIFINIDKAIPASAGLGGGSADCAAALLGIRDLFGLPLTNAEIQTLSVEFGADVPFCVLRGTAHATGIGEELKPLPQLPYVHILLAKPPVIASTAEVFANYKPGVGQRPDMERVLHGIESRSILEICRGMGNVLESVTIAKHPIVGQLKEFIMAQGAIKAMMTGSGPTVFGIFMRKDDAFEAARAIKKNFESIKEVFVTKPSYPYIPTT